MVQEPTQFSPSSKAHTFLSKVTMKRPHASGKPQKREKLREKAHKYSEFAQTERNSRAFDPSFKNNCQTFYECSPEKRFLPESLQMREAKGSFADSHPSVIDGNATTCGRVGAICFDTKNMITFSLKTG